MELAMVGLVCSGAFTVVDVHEANEPLLVVELFNPLSKQLRLVFECLRFRRYAVDHQGITHLKPSGLTISLKLLIRWN